MNKFIFATVTILSAFVASAEATITGVTARQRYPWNGKVDISYTASGVAETASAHGLSVELKVMAINRTTSPWTTNIAKSAYLFVGPLATEPLTDSVALVDGAHRIVWDMGAQGLVFTSADMVFAVSAEGSPLSDVQLWKDGPYWARCNVGATKPEEAGYYFWWGDTVGYKRNAADNGWISVKNGTSFSFAEANCPTYDKSVADLTSSGYVNGTGNLVSAHDAATQYLGAPWRLPTDAEVQALVDNCTSTWVENWNGTGVNGCLVAGKGDYAFRSIFLPAVGYGLYANSITRGSYGLYWSSTPNSDHSYHAWYLNFDASYFTKGTWGYRFTGQCVRPVRGSAK